MSSLTRRGSGTRRHPHDRRARWRRMFAEDYAHADQPRSIRAARSTGAAPRCSRTGRSVFEARAATSAGGDRRRHGVDGPTTAVGRVASGAGRHRGTASPFSGMRGGDQVAGWPRDGLRRGSPAVPSEPPSRSPGDDRRRRHGPGCSTSAIAAAGNGPEQAGATCGSRLTGGRVGERRSRSSVADADAVQLDAPVRRPADAPGSAGPARAGRPGVPGHRRPELPSAPGAGVAGDADGAEVALDGMPGSAAVGARAAANGRTRTGRGIAGTAAAPYCAARHSTLAAPTAGPDAGTGRTVTRALTDDRAATAQR